jgi:GNAT superfamily N-acetyltransferase
VKLRAMKSGAAELARVDRLMMTAYGTPSRRAELAVYLRAQPDGWFVVVDGEEIVAAGGAVAYGCFCWLGLVATDPARRRQGLATRLSAHILQWALDRGCKTVALDASPAGRPVYEALGFTALGETVQLSVPETVGGGDQPTAVVPGTEGFDAVLALDRRVFGADRSTILLTLASDPGTRCFTAHADSTPGGYLFAGENRIGPGCANDATVARKLVSAASRTSSTERQLLVPMESSYLSALLALGLRERRRLTHMRFGEPILPGERTWLIGQTSYAAG